MLILVVDDNALIRQTIVEILRPEGFNIIECSDGLEAIEVCKKQSPDWILMDIRMKNVGGFEAAWEIKKIDRNIKIIALSNYNTKLYRKRAEALQYNAYFTKNNLLTVKQYLIENTPSNKKSDNSK